MKFSSKVEKCGLSPMRKFHPYAVAAKARGVNVYHLNIGQPDVQTLFRPAFSARPAATTEKVKRTRACRRWWENMKLFLSAPNSSAVSRRRVCPANGGASVSSQRVAAM